MITASVRAVNCGRPPVIDSPWYHTAPRMAYGSTGCNIAFHSSAGLCWSWCGFFGARRPACAAAGARPLAWAPSHAAIDPSNADSSGANCGSAASVARLTHACAVLAPNEALMNPTGRPIAACRSRAKKYPTAENAPTVAGEHTSQWPPQSSCGWSVSRMGTVNMRTSGWSAAAISAASLATPANGFNFFETLNSMFDCPDPSHTSPTSTSWIVIVFRPAIVICVAPAIGGSGASRTVHLPSAPASADCDCPSSVTVTRSPGVARPHTGTGIPCCTTMWSENSAAGVTSARATPPNNVTTARASRRLRIMWLLRWMRPDIAP